MTLDRWHRLLGEQEGTATFSSRWLVDRACGYAITDTGWVGFGPGTFPVIFPYYSGRVAGDLTGFWAYAHNDYLQTLIEWGWGGTFLWALLLGGSCGVLATGWRRVSWRTEDQIFGAGILLSLAGIFLMAWVDFPLQIASLQLYTAVLIGLGWSSRTWPPRKEAKEILTSSFFARIFLRTAGPFLT